MKLLRDIPRGATLRQSDVVLDGTLDAVRLRGEMESMSRPKAEA